MLDWTENCIIFLKDLNFESQVVTPLAIIIYSETKPATEGRANPTRPREDGSWGSVLSALVTPTEQSTSSPALECSRSPKSSRSSEIMDTQCLHHYVDY